MVSVGKVLVAGLLTAGLAACADESPFGPGELFTWNASQWSVSDRPDLGALQIVATNPQVAGIGTAAVYRFNTGDPPAPVFAVAVQGWFLTHGRHCTATAHEAVDPRTHVFHYTCWEPTGAIG